MHWALDAFQPILKQLSTLTIQSLEHYAFLPTYQDTLAENNIKDLIIIVHGLACEKWQNVVKCHPLIERHYLSLAKENELSMLLDKDVN